jgi:hypothetical protein
MAESTTRSLTTKKTSLSTANVVSGKVRKGRGFAPNADTHVEDTTQFDPIEEKGAGPIQCKTFWRFAILTILIC